MGFWGSNDGSIGSKNSSKSSGYKNDGNLSSGGSYCDNYDKYDETIMMVDKTQNTKLDLNMSNLSNEKKFNNLPVGVSGFHASTGDLER